MQAHEVTLFEQLVERIRAADSQGLVVSLRDKRVVKDDVEPERPGPQGHRGADPAAADQAEGLAAQPGRARGIAVVPPSRSDRRGARDQPSSDRQKEHQGVVGHFLGAVIRDVAHDHAMSSGGGPVDVVVTDAGPDDASAPGGPREGGLADRRDLVKQDQGVGRIHMPGELGLAGGAGQLDPGDIAQDRGLDHRVFEEIGDHDAEVLRHRTSDPGSSS